MMISLNCLPVDILIEIFVRTDGETLGKCKRVCKQWKDIIDSNDHLWFLCCKREYKYSSKVAKNKSGEECAWYHIYKNLVLWKNVSTFDRNVKELYKFSLHDSSHALDISYGIIPLKDQRGIVLYDMSTMKYIPVAVPEKNCTRIEINHHSTAILVNSGLMLQRSVEKSSYMTEAFFNAEDFVLTDDSLYFCNKREIHKCSLATQNLTSKIILHCDYDIKTMQANNRILYLFTDCGKIITVVNDKDVSVKPMNIPIEWIKQIKHIQALDDKNFVCYSRNLFKIETDQYQHLYLDFPPITSLFFYGDVVLIGTKTGEILLYRLSSQKRAIKPVFEKLAVLPEGKFAVHLDICERKSGPVIVAATFFEIFLLEIVFFPQEILDTTKRTFTSNKVLMYKRLLRLKDRLQCFETIPS